MKIIAGVKKNKHSVYMEPRGRRRKTKSRKL